jgi:hypothetical protein
MTEQVGHRSTPRISLQEQSDLVWKRYVAELAPTDEGAAFLLPEELPAATSSPEACEEAIMRATRRAFAFGVADSSDRLTWLQRLLRWLIGNIPRRRRFKVVDYELGTIRGELNVLLPQGREVRLNFHDDLGWKATIQLGEEPDQQEFTMYYRESCMNPARVLARKEGEIDASKVEFRPLEKDQVEEIVNNPEIDLITRWNARRLMQEYEYLAGHRMN